MITKDNFFEHTLSINKIQNQLLKENVFKINQIKTFKLCKN